MKKQPEQAITKIEEAGLAQVKRDMILEKTPAKYILKRKGRGGMVLDYVEVGYIISKLNETFNYMWSFKVIESKIDAGQIWVLGELTAHLIIPVPNGQPIVQAIVKSQYGGSELKKSNGVIIDSADDYKAATSDALKKCASMFGIAQDVFWKSEKASAPARTAESIVYSDRPSTATPPAPSAPPAEGAKLATDSQKTWIRKAVADGKITLDDATIEHLTFDEAVREIGKIREGLGK